MAKEPQLLPGVPRERVYVKFGPNGVTPSLENFRPPTAPPTAHAPIQKAVAAIQTGQEAETKSVRAQLAQMQNDIDQLRRQLAAADARIDELRKRLAPN